MPLDELRRQFEVNMVGQLAVTQAALPALRAGTGGSSTSARSAGASAQPFAGAYCGSKAAVRLMSSSLRRELRPVGHLGDVHRARDDQHRDLGKNEDAEHDAADRGVAPDGRARYGGAHGAAWAQGRAQRSHGPASSPTPSRCESSMRCSRGARGPTTRSAATRTRWARCRRAAERASGTASWIVTWGFNLGFYSRRPLGLFGRARRRAASVAVTARISFLAGFALNPIARENPKNV